MDFLTYEIYHLKLIIKIYKLLFMVHYVVLLNIYKLKNGINILVDIVELGSWFRS
jgi:hypothetical protein